MHHNYCGLQQDAERMQSGPSKWARRSGMHWYVVVAAGRGLPCTLEHSVVRARGLRASTIWCWSQACGSHVPRGFLPCLSRHVPSDPWVWSSCCVWGGSRVGWVGATSWPGLTFRQACSTRPPATATFRRCCFPYGFPRSNRSGRNGYSPTLYKSRLQPQWPKKPEV